MEGENKTILTASLIGVIPVTWFALLVAPSMDGGLMKMVSEMGERLQYPFRITIVPDSLRAVILFLLIYGMAIGIYLSSRRNYRRGEEHGSAKWGTTAELNRKYADKVYSNNKLLTNSVRIGLDDKKHMRNLNTLVVGGSGSGKTRFYCKPNVMQANTSMVVLDPKGEILRATGNLLKERGYKVKVLDLIDMDNSDCYNPFLYLETDNDVQRLVTNLFKATTPKGAQTQDPFWDNAAQMLLHALIFLVKYEAPEEEQNFAAVMELLRAGEVTEGDPDPSRLDDIFNDLAKRDPYHIALKYYRAYRVGADKTLKSIQISLATRLEKFNLESMAKLTSTDELDLPSLGEEKVALFAIIPDNDTSFNFLVSILYTQLFQQLFLLADREYKGTLPVPVHFVMDEFANVSLPDDFDKILSVMRSRGVFVSIILQNLAQIKALFEKQWESIVGNCDEFVYLGGNEQATHKYVSELLGKETIDTNTFNRSYGSRGHYTKNDQIQGRELMTPDEVRRMNNRFALLFIRGERAVMDAKYNLMKHPDIKLTLDGGAEPYVHSDETYAEAETKGSFFVFEEYEEEKKEVVCLNSPDDEKKKETKTGYVLLSEEDLYEEFFGKKNNQETDKKKEEEENESKSEE